MKKSLIALVTSVSLLAPVSASGFEVKLNESVCRPEPCYGMCVYQKDCKLNYGIRLSKEEIREVPEEDYILENNYILLSEIATSLYEDGLCNNLDCAGYSVGDIVIDLFTQNPELLVEDGTAWRYENGYNIPRSIYYTITTRRADGICNNI